MIQQSIRSLPSLDGQVAPPLGPVRRCAWRAATGCCDLFHLAGKVRSRQTNAERWSRRARHMKQTSNVNTSTDYGRSLHL